MQIKASQLREHLKQGLQSIYFIYGDEPLQIRDYTDMVRNAAKYYGYDEREKYTADQQFDWQQLHDSACELSLFSTKKLIEIHLPTAKPGDKGAKALTKYTENIPEDTILLLYCGKLESASQRSKWFKTLDKVAYRVPVYPLQEGEIKNWLVQRLYKEGLQINSDSLDYFYSHIEGNMLSADQEIIKLGLLYKINTEQTDIISISHEQLINAIYDNALYNHFDLFDTALKGDTNQVLDMLKQFSQDGTALVFLLFIISKEIRMMANINHYANQMPLAQALQKEYIFPKRKRLIQQVISQHKTISWLNYLSQLAEIEKLSKGVKNNQLAGSCAWNSLAQLLVRLSVSFKSK